MRSFSMGRGAKIRFDNVLKVVKSKQFIIKNISTLVYSEPLN